MCCRPLTATHLPFPPFLLAQTLSPKHIAPCDIVKFQAEVLGTQLNFKLPITLQISSSNTSKLKHDIATFAHDYVTRHSRLICDIIATILVTLVFCQYLNSHVT